MDESLLLGLYTADGMQKVDGTAIHGIGIPGGHLMERAGLAVATEILELLGERFSEPRTIVKTRQFVDKNEFLELPHPR